jgi:hypothetical protein
MLHMLHMFHTKIGCRKLWGMGADTEIEAIEQLDRGQMQASMVT